MRVLYSFPRVIGRAGIGTTAFHQVDQLTRQGVDVTAFVKQCERWPEVKGLRETLPARRWIPHRLLGAQSLAAHDARVAAFVLRRGREFDLVHTWPGAARLTLRAAAHVGLPSILELANTHVDNQIAVATSLDLSGADASTLRAHRTALLHEYAAATYILAPSDAVRDSFVRRGTSADKVLRHSYGHDFHGRAAPAPDEPRRDALAFTACYMGKLQPRKGVHVALAAWRGSRAAEGGGRLLLAGSWEPTYRDRLADLLEHSSIAELGFVDDVASVMGQADVLVFPTFEEGSALVTYEAQALGLLCLTTEASGIHVIDREGTRFHVPGDVGTLAAQIDDAFDDRPRLRRVRSKAPHASDQLTWAAAGTRLLDAYEHVLGEASSDR